MTPNNPIPTERGAADQTAASASQNTTKIAVILDRSGSTEAITSGIIGGFNAIIFLAASQDAGASAARLSIPPADGCSFAVPCTGSWSGVDAMGGIVRLKRGRGRPARIRRPRSALPASPRPSCGPGGGQPSRLDPTSVFPGSPAHRTPNPARTHKPKPSMPHPEIIPQESVTLDRLGLLLQQAFYQFEREENEKLFVETDGPTVQVTINEDHHLLKFQSLYSFKPCAPPDQKLAFVNRLNDSVIFARFSLPEGHEDVLVADYYLPFVLGAPAHQIINALRLFSRIVPAAFKFCDEEDLLE